MLATDFHFSLPPTQIAQTPAAERDQARLLVVDAVGAARHRRVVDLPDLLPANALLVVNDTRVLPARLYGSKPSGGRFELLLVEPMAQAAADGRAHWLCMGRSSKPFRAGPLLLDGIDAPSAELIIDTPGEASDAPDRLLHIAFAVPPEALPAVLDRIGQMPLPPYIEKERGRADHRALDRERYQTVYASHPGAVAAPTAGLHFTPRLLAALEVRGIERCAVTLHVGPGTFSPLRTNDVDAVTELHTERYDVPTATAQAFARAKQAERPVFAVGTTVARTLEAAICADGTLKTGPGSTGLFIKPGFAFQAIDGLLTNFHLPRSTLLMLVCALAGQTRVLDAYAEAVAAGYRFYSYGDAMLLTRST